MVKKDYPINVCEKRIGIVFFLFMREKDYIWSNSAKSASTTC